jgi:membrane protein DedA with SNARE-associated domain
LLDSLLAWLDLLGASVNNPLGLAVLCGSALIEYVFPPYPGDVITVFGGVLVGAYQWRLLLVFLAVTTGSVLGGLLAFELGKGWQKRRGPGFAEEETRLARLVKRFEKHGSLYLLLNRFIPGIRPLFFVAAGLAGMRIKRVLVLSTISAAVYNSALIVAGMSVGNNLSKIEEWIKTYSLIVWAVLAVIGMVALLRAAMRRG